MKFLVALWQSVVFWIVAPELAGTTQNRSRMPTKRKTGGKLKRKNGGRRSCRSKVARKNNSSGGVEGEVAVASSSLVDDEAVEAGSEDEDGSCDDKSDSDGDGTDDDVHGEETTKAGGCKEASQSAASVIEIKKEALPRALSRGEHREVAVTPVKLTPEESQYEAYHCNPTRREAASNFVKRRLKSILSGSFGKSMFEIQHGHRRQSVFLVPSSTAGQPAFFVNGNVSDAKDAVRKNEEIKGNAFNVEMATVGGGLVHTCDLQSHAEALEIKHTNVSEDQKAVLYQDYAMYHRMPAATAARTVRSLLASVGKHYYDASQMAMHDRHDAHLKSVSYPQDIGSGNHDPQGRASTTRAIDWDQFIESHEKDWRVYEEVIGKESSSTSAKKVTKDYLLKIQGTHNQLIAGAKHMTERAQCAEEMLAQAVQFHAQNQADHEWAMYRYHIAHMSMCQDVDSAQAMPGIIDSAQAHARQQDEAAQLERDETAIKHTAALAGWQEEEDALQAQLQHLAAKRQALSGSGAVVNTQRPSVSSSSAIMTPQSKQQGTSSTTHAAQHMSIGQLLGQRASQSKHDGDTRNQRSISEFYPQQPTAKVHNIPVHLDKSKIASVLHAHGITNGQPETYNVTKGRQPSPEADDVQFFDVNFTTKEKAKALGAQWEPHCKLWYTDKHLQPGHTALMLQAFKPINVKPMKVWDDVYNRYPLCYSDCEVPDAVDAERIRKQEIAMQTEPDHTYTASEPAAAHNSNTFTHPLPQYRTPTKDGDAGAGHPPRVERQPFYAETNAPKLGLTHLIELAKLKEQGVIDEEEFKTLKTQLLGKAASSRNLNGNSY